MSEFSKPGLTPPIEQKEEYKVDQSNFSKPGLTPPDGQINPTTRSATLEEIKKAYAEGKLHGMNGKPPEPSKEDEASKGEYKIDHTTRSATLEEIKKAYAEGKLHGMNGKPPEPGREEKIDDLRDKIENEGEAPVTEEEVEELGTTTVDVFVWSQFGDNRDYRSIGANAENNDRHQEEIEAIIDNLGQAYLELQTDTLGEAWLWFSFPTSSQEQICCCHVTWGENTNSSRSKIVIQTMSMQQKEMRRLNMTQADMTESSFWQKSDAFNSQGNPILNSPTAEASFTKHKNKQRTERDSGHGELPSREEAIDIIQEISQSGELQPTDAALILVPRLLFPGDEERFQKVKKKLGDITESLSIEVEKFIETAPQSNTQPSEEANDEERPEPKTKEEAKAAMREVPVKVGDVFHVDIPDVYKPEEVNEYRVTVKDIHISETGIVDIVIDFIVENQQSWIDRLFQKEEPYQVSHRRPVKEWKRLIPSEGVWAGSPSDLLDQK